MEFRRKKRQAPRLSVQRLAVTCTTPARLARVPAQTGHGASPRMSQASGIMDAMSLAYCHSGHLIESSVIDPDDFAAVTPYSTSVRLIPRRCHRCGLRVVTRCRLCSAPIARPPGRMLVPSHVAFCSECGGPYPWASPSQVRAYVEAVLVEDGSLTEAEQTQLAASLEDAVAGGAD